MLEKEPGFNRVMRSTSTQLNLITSSYLINWGLWSYFNSEIDFLNSVDAYLLDQRNRDFAHAIKFVKALNLFKQGYVANGFKLIDELRGQSEDESGRFEMILGKWCMTHGAYYQASKLFETARENGYPDATMDLAKAYARVDNGSVGQFILRKQLEMEVDPGRINQINELINQIANGQLATSIQDFTADQKSLEALINDQNTDEEEIFEMAGRNPFNELGVLQGVTYFNDTKQNQDKAYELLVNAVAINEYSQSLNIAYVDQCLVVGLTSYAESTIIKLREIMTPEAYDAYVLEFEKRKAGQEASLENW